MSGFFEFSATSIDGRPISFSQYSGNVVLAVNVASACGFTPQYAGLEKLHKDLGPEGLVVLGFPCNQFGEQEAGSETEISQFCEVNFGVSFQMFSKIDVNGASAHPAYVWLKQNCATGTDDIGWNFNKFLADRSGNCLNRYGADVEPEDLRPAIEAAL